MNRFARMLMRAACTVMLLLSGASLRAEVTTSFTEPDETIEVACAEPGVVAQVLVKQGQAVKAGAILAILDNAVLEAGLRAAETKARSTAKIDLARVEVNLKERQKAKLSLVLADGHASANEIEKAEAELAASQAQLRLSEEEAILSKIEVDQIKAQIERRTIRSPVDGVATRVRRRPGEFLSSSEPVIATVVRLDQLRVKFYVSTEMAERLQSNGECTVSVRGQRIAGRIDFLSPVTDADSGTVRMEVLLDNRSHTLRSGISSQLEVVPALLTPVRGSAPVVVQPSESGLVAPTFR